MAMTVSRSVCQLVGRFVSTSFKEYKMLKRCIINHKCYNVLCNAYCTLCIVATIICMYYIYDAKITSNRKAQMK